MQRAAIDSFLTAYGWERLGRSIRDLHASASTGINALAAWRFGGFRRVDLAAVSILEHAFMKPIGALTTNI